jgi:hypothetical protein
MDINTDILLGAISPVVYSLVKEGDLAEVRRQAPRRNEYRDKIPPAEETLLVFRGNTKIGMIPQNIVSKVGAQALLGKCRVVRLSKDSNVVAVKLVR